MSPKYKKSSSKLRDNKKLIRSEVRKSRKPEASTSSRRRGRDDHCPQVLRTQSSTGNMKLMKNWMMWGKMEKSREEGPIPDPDTSQEQTQAPGARWTRKEAYEVFSLAIRSRQQGEKMDRYFWKEESGRQKLSDYF